MHKFTHNSIATISLNKTFTLLGFEPASSIPQAVAMTTAPRSNCLFRFAAMQYFRIGAMYVLATSGQHFSIFSNYYTFMYLLQMVNTFPISGGVLICAFYGKPKPRYM
jgi:hypothetical protein